MGSEKKTTTGWPGWPGEGQPAMLAGVTLAFPCVNTVPQLAKLTRRLRECLDSIKTGWCFGTCFVFPYIGNNNPVFFRGVDIPTRSKFESQETSGNTLDLFWIRRCSQCLTTDKAACVSRCFARVDVDNCQKCWYCSLASLGDVPTL